MVPERPRVPNNSAGRRVEAGLWPCHLGPATICAEPPLTVESRRGAVALGRACLFPPLSSGGALVAQPWLRFHTPLIEPDVQISRIRLSDKTSRLRPRHVVPKPAQTYEPEVPVEVREWKGPAPSSPDFVLGAQPPA